MKNRQYNFIGEFTILEVEERKTKYNNPFIKLILKNDINTEWGYIFDLDSTNKFEFNKNDRVQVWGYKSSINNLDCIICKKITEMADKRSYKLRKLNRFFHIIKDKNLKKLLEIFFNDNRFLDSFFTAYGSSKNHHAYKGGLFDHTMDSIEIGIKLLEVNQFRNINRELFLMGLFLHDLGKIFELSNNINKNRLTLPGYMLGHVALGQMLLQKKVQNIENFPKIYLINLLHIILSHHSNRYNPSSIKPATPEAILVNRIETMNAEIESMCL